MEEGDSRRAQPEVGSKRMSHTFNNFIHYTPRLQPHTEGEIYQSRPDVEISSRQSVPEEAEVEEGNRQSVPEVDGGRRLSSPSDGGGRRLSWAQPYIKSNKRQPTTSVPSTRRLSQTNVEGIYRRRRLSNPFEDGRRRSYPNIETRGRLTSLQFMESKTQYIKQILYGIIVASSEFLIGVMFGWPAILPNLSDAERLELQLTSHIEGYLISCVFISGLLTNLIAGFLREFFGPRTLVLMTLPPVILSFVPQALFLNVWVLFAGRLILGCITGVLTSVVQTLVAELCCPKIRGFLSSIPELFVSMGLLYAYVLAQYLPFRWFNGLCALPTLVTLICIPLVPESPYWLVSKGMKVKAEVSVQKLHSRYSQKELTEIQNNVIPDSTFLYQVKEMMHPRNYRPIILVIFIFLLRDLAGNQFIFSYVGHLFEEADISIDSSWCPILIGMCRMTFTIISASTVDYVGRRPLLMSSAGVCGLSLLTAGVSVYLDLHALCIAAVLIFAASYSIGEGPIAWVILGELTPLPVRSQGSSLALISFFCSGFLTTLLYPKLSVLFGLDILFYICAIFNFILMGTVWEFLPETKNASLCDVKNAYDERIHSLITDLSENIDPEQLEIPYSYIGMA